MLMYASCKTNLICIKTAFHSASHTGPRYVPCLIIFYIAGLFRMVVVSRKRHAVLYHRTSGSDSSLLVSIFRHKTSSRTVQCKHLVWLFCSRKTIDYLQTINRIHDMQITASVLHAFVSLKIILY